MSAIASSSAPSASSECDTKAPPPQHQQQSTLMFPQSPPDVTMTSPPTTAAIEESAVDCIFCLSSLPLDRMPLTGEYEPVAQLVPCSHFMHDHCLKPWTEIANTCPICRVSFNEVNIRPFMKGLVLSSYRVEDKVQRVVDHGVDIPPEQEEENLIGIEDDAALMMDLVREQRIWAAAWERLDADLEQPAYPEDEDDFDDYYERQVMNRRQRIREQRMNRRRAVAAAQTGPGRNAFDDANAGWRLPTTRPRTTFPHLEHQMSKEESDSWKMMELAEKLENSRNKRRRGSGSEEDLLARMGVDTTQPERDARKFKRPRTKRDSQLPAINTRNHNGESSRTGEAAAVGTPTASTSDAGSPPSGGIFTTILEGIGKFQDVPIVSAADVSGRDLGRMRPISPDRSSINSAMSRSRSPPAIFSPPSSRPNSPDGDFARGRIFSPSSPTSPRMPRTPAGSPQRIGRRRPWEFPQQQQPTSPPASRMQSPDGAQTSRRRHSHLADEPTSSNSDSEQQQQDQKPRKPSITKECKADIVKMVSAALKPLYPAKISKEKYTEINKKISRKMYKMVSEADDGAAGVGVDRQMWHAAIEKEVEKELNALEVM